MQHFWFIIAAYGVTALVMVGLILRAIVDYRAQRKTLDDIEARGTQRRSSRG